MAELPSISSSWNSKTNPYPYDFKNNPKPLSDGYFPDLTPGSRYEVSCFGLEKGQNMVGYQYAEIKDLYRSMNRSGESINDLLRIYVNHERKDEGIILYFNYNNYLNPPF